MVACRVSLPRLVDGEFPLVLVMGVIEGSATGKACFGTGERGFVGARGVWGTFCLKQRARGGVFEGAGFDAPASMLATARRR